MNEWEQLDQRYMTEESDGDDGLIVEHRLKWRSKRKEANCSTISSFMVYPFSFIGLNDLIVDLDKRYEDRVTREGGTMPKKARICGQLSTTASPPNAPKWAVKEVIYKFYTVLSPYVCM